MTAERIRQIVMLIGAASPYWRMVQSAGVHSLPLEVRFHIALADPALGWHLALSYADAGLPLPAGLSECAIQRAYQFLRDPYRRDVHVLRAQDLTRPENQSSRDLLRALLLCNTTLEQVAQDCGLPVGVVELFEALFWNCRDRLQERVYLEPCSRNPQEGTWLACGPLLCSGRLLRVTRIRASCCRTWTCRRS
jgi:hypothetical protein